MAQKRRVELAPISIAVLASALVALLGYSLIREDRKLADHTTYPELLDKIKSLEKKSTTERQTIEDIQDRINNIETRVGELEKKRQPDTARRANTSKNAHDFVRNVLGTIGATGSRLTRGELDTALSTRFRNLFSDKDLERIRDLSNRFDQYDEDNDSRLGQSEIKSALFR